MKITYLVKGLHHYHKCETTRPEAKAAKKLPENQPRPRRVDAVNKQGFFSPEIFHTTFVDPKQRENVIGSATERTEQQNDRTL